MAKKKSSRRVKSKVKRAVGSAAKKSVRKKKNGLSVLIFVVLIAAFALLYLYDSGMITLPAWLRVDEQKTPFVPDGNAQVHFIDVGQGDCSLLIADDGTTMLIDCGEAEYSATVIRYLNDLGISKLDYVLETHPHSDHMGGMADIISSDIEIGKFIMPKVADNYIPITRVYERLLLALVDKGYSVYPSKSETIQFGAGEIEFIMTDYAGDNLNNYSTVVRFTFGERSFVFSGDAESDIEKKIVMSGYDLSADVYKVGHHGSTTSSSYTWLAAIDPDYCVIECGAGNSYGHPHSETVKLLHEYTDIILRTDINGNIVFTTDGENIEYTTSK